jgi:coenzyme F420 hydrogenase subunit beta
MTTEVPGLQRLRSQVIDAGLCTLCGACSGLCPYIRPFKGRVAIVDPCILTRSRCYEFCPRTGVDLDRTSELVFGIPYDGSPLGCVRRVVIARSRDPEIRQRAQYGGTVSALVCFALEKGLIHSAVLTRSFNGEPRGVVASTRDEVLQCSGSSYLAAPTLEAFNQLPVDDQGGIGVVGTPCQILALINIGTSHLASRSNFGRLKLAIGLFCTWALSYSFLRKLAGIAPISRVVKMDIPPPPASIFEVYTAEGRTAIPLDEVRPFIPAACTLCHDMTAEMADLSVGAVEGIEGWNTVLIRTERGEELFEEAVSSGILERGELPQANLDHLTESALIKKRRALTNIMERTKRRDDLLYLRLRPETVERILEGR